MQLWAGTPAVYVRDISELEAASIVTTAAETQVRRAKTQGTAEPCFFYCGQRSVEIVLPLGVFAIPSSLEDRRPVPRIQGNGPSRWGVGNKRRLQQCNHTVL